MSIYEEKQIFIPFRIGYKVELMSCCLFMKRVCEILNLWKDHKNGAIADRHALIRCLEENQKANGCSQLILKLKGASGNKSIRGSSSSNETSADMYQATRSTSYDSTIQPQGNVTIQYGSGIVDNTNHGVGYVSGNGNQITMDSHDKKWINKRSAGVMACDDAKISENAINAGAIMGDVGTFSGNISGNTIGSSAGSFKNDQIATEKDVIRVESNVNEMKGDEKLKKELESHKIVKLYPKFLKAGVNTNVLWGLDEEMLEIIELDKLEMFLYKTAKENNAAAGK